MLRNNIIKRALARLGFKINFYWHAHLLNPLWLSREERRYRRLKATNKTAKQYLSQYQDILKRLSPPVPDNDSDESERAYAIWLQGEENAPMIVKACFQSMRKHLGQELEVLDEKTLFDRISIPDYIIEKWKTGKMSNAHFSDICRVELLFQHGGVWFDATDFVTAPVPEQIMDSDFFVFMAGTHIKSLVGYIQNCFIRAKKGNPLIGLWRDAILEYWKHEDSVINYYTHQILFQLLTEENANARMLFQEMPRIEQDPTHVLWFGHRDDPYSEEAFKTFTSETFFQKINFKDERASNPLPGSMAEYIMNSGKTDETITG